MFDNLLHQEVAQQIKNDIVSNKVPGAILLSGPQSSGKLTCALELARIMACHNDGSWQCTCPSCTQYKALVNINMLLTGPRNCGLEIAASKKTFLDAVSQNSRYISSTRYLFVRSIRKLTMRFNQILWKDDDKLSKIATHTSAIDETLEEIDAHWSSLDIDDITKLCDEAEGCCAKLENAFMYESIPISQVRNANEWARLSVFRGKKVIIIENAEKMLEGARNAFLKILEEPPTDTMFVLTTSNKSAVMPTILSRVRSYLFADRTEEQQKDVLRRVFHVDDDNSVPGSIDKYLLTFLPVKPSVIKSTAEAFYNSVSVGIFPDASDIVKSCGGFQTRLVLKSFLIELQSCFSSMLSTASGTYKSSRMLNATRSCWTNVSIYNQTPSAAIEKLTRSLLGG